MNFLKKYPTVIHENSRAKINKLDVIATSANRDFSTLSLKIKKSRAKVRTQKPTINLQVF